MPYEGRKILLLVSKKVQPTKYYIEICHSRYFSASTEMFPSTFDKKLKLNGL